LKVLTISAILITFSILSGCAATPSVEAPICVPERPLLTPVSIQGQRLLKEADADSFDTIAHNDVAIKSHVRLLESLIVSHDQGLGECD
jgi:hypothetical protein